MTENTPQIEPGYSFDDVPALKDDNSATSILHQLLAHIESVTFEPLVYDNYPSLDDAQKRELKLFQKHYLVITIEKLIEISRAKNWGLCQRQGYYYVYNGEYWNALEIDDLKSFLGKVAEKMGVPKFDSRHYEFKDKLFKQFEATAHLPEPDISSDTVLINLLNGTFEISEKAQRLRGFDQKDFITYQLPFEYDPEAKAPLFEAYLNEVLPDHESQRVLAEFMGYIFTRNLKLEKVLFLYGTGRNGKSVMFEIIRALLRDENISYYGLANLTDDKGYHRAKLVNKLINWASDIGDKLQSNTFKQLASGEPVDARLPHKDPFQIQNICKFAFNTNTLPTDVEHSDAFFERFLIVPFTVYIEPEKRDSKLPEKIISKELPGVFNWVLEGLERLLSQGKFSPCKASDDTLKTFRKDSDSVHLFVDETDYHPTANSWIKAKPVYDQYREYCFGEGLRPLARKNFHKRLESLGYFSGVKDIGKVLFMARNGSATNEPF